MIKALVERLRCVLSKNANSKWVYDHIYYHRWITHGLTMFNAGIASVEPPVSAVDIERHQREVYREAIAVCQNSIDCQPTRILELGCGLGGGLLQLSMAYPKAHCFGLDLSLTGLRSAQQVSGQDVVGGDAQKLPLIAECCDVLVTVELFHKLEPIHFLHEAWRVLRPGGLLCVVDFRLGNFEQLAPRLRLWGEETGYTTLGLHDLTHRVVEAADIDSFRHRKLLARIPWGGRNIGRELLVMPGSARYLEYMNGGRCYFMLLLKKSAATSS